MTTQSIDPLFLVKSSTKLDDKTKVKITSKLRVLTDIVSEIENFSGLPYPKYYIEPTMTISISSDNLGGIGVLYARTIPVDARGIVEVMIQISAPLLLFSRKTVLTRILAHEFLHYLELVQHFASGNTSSELSPDSLFEEKYQDAGRAIEPKMVFPKKRKLVAELNLDFENGFSDDKLNEKCRKSWLEKGLPTVKISMGANQVKISASSIARSRFDQRTVEFLRKLNSK